MFGAGELLTAVNVSAITNLLDAYGTGKALFSDSLIPSDFTGNKSINFYMAVPFTNREYKEYRYTIHCRAKTYNESIAIAYAVYTAINRVHYTDYFILCDVLSTIPPQDVNDNYNTPVEALIKQR